MITRYFDSAIQGIFSDEHKWELWMQVELAYLKARHDEGDPLATKTVLEKANATMPPHRSDVNKFEMIHGHDVFAWLAAWTEYMSDDVASQIHLGLTSSDLADNALFHQVDLVRERVMRSLGDLINELEVKSDALMRYGRLSRTHGQWAEPSQFGWRFEVWCRTASMLYEQGYELRSTVCVFKMPGASGNARFLGKAVANRAAQLWGASLLPSTQVIPRQRLLLWAAWMVSVISLVEEIALEIRLSSRTEVGEMSEGAAATRIGSSAMPHKRNPIQSERLSGIGRVARSMFAPIAETAGNLHNERDISNSSVERMVVPDLSHLVAFSLSEIIAILNDLTINTDWAVSMSKSLKDSAAVQYNLQRLGVPYVIAVGEARHWATIGGWDYKRILPIVNANQTDELDTTAFLGAMGQA